MDYKTVLFEIDKKVAKLKINRPQVKNALCMDFFLDLENVINTVENNQSIQLLVITGKGDSFASGADLNEVLDMDKETAYKNAKFVQDTFQSLSELKIPVIAAINGYCMGGGLELAMNCDIRISSDNALFALPESKIGICPGGTGTQMFTEITGVGNAMYYMLSGKTFDAEKALQMGIISSIVNQNDFEDDLSFLVETISSNSHEAILKIKELVLLHKKLARKEALDKEAQYFSELITTTGKEGMKAFLEKRKPDWN